MLRVYLDIIAIAFFYQAQAKDHVVYDEICGMVAAAALYLADFKVDIACVPVFLHHIQIKLALDEVGAGYDKGGNAGAHNVLAVI
jgi:hypothetical protein